MSDITREPITRATYRQMIADAGFTTEHLESLEFHPDGIYATVFATDEHGQVLFDGNEAARHRVYVPVKEDT